MARRWRPKSFSELIGQSHITQTLFNALRHNRLHHALLFTGPRGTGKTSSARILAKSLRCAYAIDFVPCHNCRDCQDVAAGRSLDVIEIDGASNNGVDAIRELRETIGYMPSSGTYKLYIIDEVHMLSTSAFNALLKTLEEPPSHVIFILATTEVHKIPNTILSRCQRFDFRRIPVRDIASHLAEICKAEDVKVDEEALWLIARQGDGSMRDSQSLLDQAITFSGGQLSQEKTIEILGLTDRTLLFGALEGFVNRDSKKIMAIIERIFTAGYDPKIFIQDLLEELRHLLFIKMSFGGKVTELVDLPESEIIQLKSVASELSEEDIHLLFDIALKGSNDIFRAQDTRVVLEMLLLKMVSAPRLINIFSALDGVQPESPRQSLKLKSQKIPVVDAVTPSSTSSNDLPSSTVRPVEAVLTESKDNGDMESKWLDLISKVKKINPMVGAKLEHTCLLGLHNRTILIGVSDKMRFLSGQVEDKEFQKKLLNYIGTFWGPGYSIDTQSTESDSERLSPKALEERRKQEDLSKLRQQVENHPFVKSTQEIFKSQIKAIKETT